MAIRPIDMQLSVPKALDFTRQHQGEINKQGTDQIHFSQVSFKEAEHKQSMVIETKESDPNVDKDGRNKQEQRKRKGNAGHSTETDEKDKKKNEGTGLFDMRI